jgi:dUTP pyrophosphatase
MRIPVINRSEHPLPLYKTANSAGMDIFANLDKNIILRPMQRYLVPTGIFMELPHGYEAQIRPRSGLALKHGITVLNTPGTIDSDYRGEIMVLLVNLSEEDFLIEDGLRIAQMIIHTYEKICWNEVNALSVTERGNGAYGHTGEK